MNKSSPIREIEAPKQEIVGPILETVVSPKQQIIALETVVKHLMVKESERTRSHRHEMQFRWEQNCLKTVPLSDFEDALKTQKFGIQKQFSAEYS